MILTMFFNRRTKHVTPGRAPPPAEDFSNAVTDKCCCGASVSLSESGGMAVDQILELVRIDDCCRLILARSSLCGLPHYAKAVLQKSCRFLPISRPVTSE